MANDVKCRKVHVHLINSEEDAPIDGRRYVLISDWRGDMAEVQVINEYGICIHHVWGEIMGDEVLKLHRTSEDLWILQKFPQYVSWIMENCPSKFSDIGYAQKLIADEKAYHSFKQKLDRAYRNTAREWVKKMILGDEVSSYPIFVVRWNGSNYDEEDFVNDLLCTKSLDSL